MAFRLGVSASAKHCEIHDLKNVSVVKIFQNDRNGCRLADVLSFPTAALDTAVVRLCCINSSIPPCGALTAVSSLMWETSSVSAAPAAGTVFELLLRG